ncbi:MAG: phosphodiester glycosidase family protein, partial [Cyanobacteriota bacterium]
LDQEHTDSSPENVSSLFEAQVASSIVPQNNQVSLDQALLKHPPLFTNEAIANSTVTEPIAPQPAPVLSQVTSRSNRQGTKVSINGRTFTVAWRQWQLGASVRTGISDIGLMQSLGVELLSTKDLTRQPVQWFSYPETTPIVLTSQLAGSYRYLDVSDFAKIAGWQMQAEGDTLKISSVPARLQTIQQQTQPWGSRIIIDLDRPIPWQVSDRRTEGVITLDASADPSLIEQFNAPPPQPPQQIQEAEDAAPVPVPVETSSDLPVVRLEKGQNQTTIRVQIPEGKRLQVFSVPNPYRLVIDLRPDALVAKDILWAPGIRWRQQYVSLGESQFPVVWLEVDPKGNRMSFKPIWSNPTTQVGTAPLTQTAQLWQASAAINAGFFNRKNQLPLGTIRRDNRWFSGPILNRGAIAWNDKGQFKMGRLSLQETLTTSTGGRLPVLFLNSGYVQPGISRYTPEWGTTYTPLTDNEVLVAVQNNQVTAQFPGGTAGQTSFPIPTNGYLLTLRADSTSAIGYLDIGTGVRIEQRTTPTDFVGYPQILSAGPLLLQNRQIVLDAKAEQFSEAFNQQMAVRSAIGTTASGTLILAAIHNRIGGRGPSLAETAQLMQQMGAIDALNLDGGSSTGLYLGGQLLDRSPYTAARVHNALGLFLPPLR